jgi:serine/threonine-protein kinase
VNKLDLPEDIRRRFQVLGLLGRGGMGVVVRARDVELDRQVVLKTVRPGLRDNEHLVERFRREARTLSRMNHPRVLGLLDFGAEDGVLYTVHPYLEGQDLRERVAERRPTVAEVRGWLGDALDGLEHAHEAGVLHRDLKPGNIFVAADGRAVLIDFGLARGEGGSSLTATDSLLGTPAYMDPATIHGDSWSPATDLYALGATTYEVLTGENPFLGEDIGETLENHLSVVPPEPREVRPDVDEDLSSLVMAMLEKDPRNRPASAALARRRLGAAAQQEGTRELGGTQVVAAKAPAPPAPSESHDPPPRSSRRRGLALGGALALGAGIVLLTGGPARQPTPAPPASRAPAPAALPAELAGLVEATRVDLNALFDARAAGEVWGDPATWREREGALQGSLRLVAWVERGGEPHELPREFRQELRVLDADSRGLGGQPIFGAVARVSPEELRVRCEDIAAENGSNPVFCGAPRDTPTWWGAAVNALDRAASRYHAYMAVRGSPPSLAPYLTTIDTRRLVSRVPDFRFEEAYVHSPEGRAALASWISEGVEAYEDFLFTLGLAIRREEVPPEAAVLACHLIHEIRWMLFSHLAQVPAAQLLAGKARSPLGHLVATALRARQDRAQRPSSHTDPDLPDHFQVGLEGSLELISMSRDDRRWAPAMHFALQRLARAPDSLADADAWWRLLEKAERAMEALPPREQRSMWRLARRHFEDRVDLPEAGARLEALASGS